MFPNPGGWVSGTDGGETNVSTEHIPVVNYK